MSDSGTVCELTQADTIPALLLLRHRPLQNVFLEHVVASGALGRVSGFIGYRSGSVLEAIAMVGPQGGMTLEVQNAAAFEALASAIHEAGLEPRHIVGAEDVTAPFYRAYQRHAPVVIWERREPYYLAEPCDFNKATTEWKLPLVEPALEHELEIVVRNSARQHVEDLQDDRSAADPDGFRERHHSEILERRWWVLREDDEIVFQLHVGPENAQVIQLGGVFTVPERRSQGYARRGLASAVASLLRSKPAVGLFCDENNQSARKVYASVGFQEVFSYRSWLFGDRSGSS